VRSIDPFTERYQSDNYNNSSHMTRGGVFENGQEGIIAIDIQDGYDKFNDNAKHLLTALKTQTLL
jgi:hypothetical protein